MTIEEIKQANSRAGFHFFDTSTLRFFRSRVGEKCYEGPGGIYFVTSEQWVHFDGSKEPRRYTVRRFHLDGKIDTVGEFNKLTKFKANWEAARLAGESKV